MNGLMQDQQLTTAMLIRHAAVHHPEREIVSRKADGSLERSNWAQVEKHARHIAAGLSELGLIPGDRVATLAWNRLPHLELYYGVSAAGMVLHTVNPRLFPEQIQYIINHGGARILCVDVDLLPIIEPMLNDLPDIERVILLCDQHEMPETGITDPISYQSLRHGTHAITHWPDIDENSANALCYTSGTTGHPKGVLYSHRSTVLHAMSALATDSMALGAADSILVVTPLFHVNAWGIPYSAAMAGCKLVLPGSAMDPISLYELMRDEGVTFSLGVPTIWFGFLDHIEQNRSADERKNLQLNRVFTGGAATPRMLIQRFRDLLGVETMQAWGMTETSPVATICRPLAHHATLSPDAQLDLRVMQGRATFGVELRIEDEDGQEIARGDDKAGLLKVRGPWVISAYHGYAQGSALDQDGWFDTGDVARINSDGFLQITDRAKDVIKSGGEWISSIDLENAAVSHPKVAEAAVIGVAHPRWQERPLMLVQLRPNETVTSQEILDHLSDKVARWWLPDDVLFVDHLPHTATGKLLKTALRAQHQHYYSNAK